MITQRISNIGHNTTYLIKITLKIAVASRSLEKVKQDNSAPYINSIIITMDLDTDSETDVSCYLYSVDELYEAVENNSKLPTEQKIDKKKICTMEPFKLNNVLNETKYELDCNVLNDCNSEINIDNIEQFEFNEALLSNDNMKINPNIENETESVTNHKNIIQDDEVNKFSIEHNNVHKNKDLYVNFEEIDTISQNTGRKRNIKPNTDTWIRNDTKSKRMRGEAYLGYRRKEKHSTLNILHDTPREERRMGPPKISLDKWNDLESLKSIIPYDSHGYYDALPHMNESVRKLKKKTNQERLIDN